MSSQIVQPPVISQSDSSETADTNNASSSEVINLEQLHGSFIVPPDENSLTLWDLQPPPIPLAIAELQDIDYNEKEEVKTEGVFKFDLDGSVWPIGPLWE